MHLIEFLMIIISLVILAFMVKNRIMPLGMAVTPTVIGDIDYQSEAFRDTLTAIITDTLAIKTSGILAPIPEPLLENKKGDFQNMPFWKTFSGTMTPITSAGVVDVNKLGTYKDRGVWLSREYAVGTEDIVKTISGNDPLNEVAKKLGLFITRNIQGIAVNVLKGVFATALATSHSTGATYSGNLITPDAVNAAKLKLGDNMTLLDRFILNSKVQVDISNLLINTYNRFDRSELYSGSNASFVGLNPFVDDTLAAVASVYSTYISEQGTVGYSFRDFERTDIQGNKISGIGIDIEPFRDPATSGGISVLYIRLYVLVHVLGTKWNVSTVNPTDAQLATGSNWAKSVDDNKKIRIVELKTR